MYFGPARERFPNLLEYTYNFHNLVGIRLEGASPANAAAISRQYGRTYSPLVGEPDITIRFSGDSARPPALRTLGLNEAAYTDDAFFVVRGKGRAQAMARFPFEAVGEDDCTIECINGPAAILSLLTPLLNLTMLRRGIIPLHATAFNYQGRSVIATGWSRSGKTETLLSFMATNGADYVGDEYIYLQDDGRMFAIPRPLTLWEWHLPDLERYWRYVEPTEQRRIKRLRRLIGIAEWGKDNLPHRLAYVAQSLEWIRGEMRRRLATKLWPQEMSASMPPPTRGRSIRCCSPLPIPTRRHACSGSTQARLWAGWSIRWSSSGSTSGMCI